MAGGKDYADKPRPVVIVQDDRFEKTHLVTVCLFTTNPIDTPLVRVLVEPTEGNGLRTASRIMADKITTVSKSKLGTRVGQLDDESMIRLGRALLIFLGIAAPKR